MWALYAFLAAFFAGVVSILAKLGLEDINSNLAVMIRTGVVLLAAVAMVFVTGANAGISDITRRTWFFLIASGLATGASWFFFFRALQLGEASRVVPIDKLSVVITIIMAFIFLGETITTKGIIGASLITIGTIFLIL